MAWDFETDPQFQGRLGRTDAFLGQAPRKDAEVLAEHEEAA